MAAGLVRVVVLLCAVVAVTRAQVWHSHGKPSGTWIRTAMAPITYVNGKKWFGVGQNGNLYERFQDTSTGIWHWVNHGKPAWSRPYNSEPCVFEGTAKMLLTTSNGYLYERFWAPPWSTAYHGRPGSVQVSGCSSVKKSNYKARTFLRGSDGHLYERFWEWSTSSWTWRWHGRPAATSVANIKTTSYLASTNGYSYVFVVGTNGNMYSRYTSQNGGGSWFNRGKPAGKVIRRIHASRIGYWWAITTDGSVCRYQGGWPCFSLTNRRILDCSDPFVINGGGRSMFCITNNGIIQGSSGYGLYQLTVFGSSVISTWVNHGVPTWYLYSSFVDRPNVVFTSGSYPLWPGVQIPKSVFVPSTNGVLELRF